MSDALTLLREARPDPAAHEPDPSAIERILLAGPERAPVARRRYVRPLVGAGGLAAAATVAIAVAPQGSSSPSVIDRAAAALTAPDTILHFRVTASGPNAAPQPFESWQTTDGRRQRTIYGGGDLEVVDDQDAKTDQSYNRERDELVDHTDPGYFDDQHQHPPGLGGDATSYVGLVGNLGALLARARDGDDDHVRYVGPATVRGVAADQIRITSTESIVIVPDGTTAEQQRRLPPTDVQVVRDVYVSHDDALPLRVVDHNVQPGYADTVTDFTDVQALPEDAATEALLKMSPHPGAKRVDEGRFD